MIFLGGKRNVIVAILVTGLMTTIIIVQIKSFVYFSIVFTKIVKYYRDYMLAAHPEKVYVQSTVRVIEKIANNKITSTGILSFDKTISK